MKKRERHLDCLISATTIRHLGIRHSFVIRHSCFVIGARRRFNHVWTFLRPSIRAMHGYVPGEQPQIADIVKLNTNENPYPAVAEGAGRDAGDPRHRPAPQVSRSVRPRLPGRRRRRSSTSIRTGS